MSFVGLNSNHLNLSLTKVDDASGSVATGDAGGKMPSPTGTVSTSCSSSTTRSRIFLAKNEIIANSDDDSLYDDYEFDDGTTANNSVGSSGSDDPIKEAEALLETLMPPGTTISATTPTTTTAVAAKAVSSTQTGSQMVLPPSVVAIKTYHDDEAADDVTAMSSTTNTSTSSPVSSIFLTLSPTSSSGWHKKANGKTQSKIGGTMIVATMMLTMVVAIVSLSHLWIPLLQIQIPMNHSFQLNQIPTIQYVVDETNGSDGQYKLKLVGNLNLIHTNHNNERGVNVWQYVMNAPIVSSASSASSTSAALNTKLDVHSFVFDLYYHNYWNKNTKSEAKSGSETAESLEMIRFGQIQDERRGHHQEQQVNPLWSIVIPTSGHDQDEDNRGLCGNVDEAECESTQPHRQQEAPTVVDNVILYVQGSNDVDHQGWGIYLSMMYDLAFGVTSPTTMNGSEDVVVVVDQDGNSANDEMIQNDDFKSSPSSSSWLALSLPSTGTIRMDATLVNVDEDADTYSSSISSPKVPITMTMNCDNVFDVWQMEFRSLKCVLSNINLDFNDSSNDMIRNI